MDPEKQHLASESSDIENDGEIEVIIKRLNREKFCISLSSTATILGLKMLIADRHHIDSETQHLIYRAQELNDNLTLSQYGIAHGCTLHLVVLQNARQNPAQSSRIYIDSMSVARLCQFIRYFALIEAVFMLITGLESHYFFGLAALSLCGYIGAKVMNRLYLLVYSLGLILEISVRAYMIYMEYPNILTVTLLAMMIFIDLFAARCVYKLYRVIPILSVDQREGVLEMNNTMC